MCLFILIFQEQAHVVLRIRKIVFFGTVFLCGVDPPVLKLQKFDSGFSEYVSVVQSSSQGSPSSLHEEDQVSIFLCYVFCDQLFYYPLTVNPQHCADMLYG